MKVQLAISLLAFALAVPTFSLAQDKATPPAPTLAGELAAHRTEVRVENMRIAGDGANLLTEAVHDAQFVFLGEDHGLAQVAQFADALFATLQPLGFNTLALEVGPFTAKELNEAVAAREEHHRAFLSQHPMTVPFYNTREEFSFLQHARQLSGGRLRIIGFDQELIGSSGLLLEQVEHEKLTPALRATVARLRGDDAAALQKARESRNPTQLFMLTAPRADLESLERELKAARLDAHPIINLLESRHIYELYTGRMQYRNNVERSLLMRKYFHQSYPDSSREKVMLKAGGEHAFKGVNPLLNRDLGNHVAELAEGHGGTSVHIIIIAAGGEQLMFAGAGAPMKPMAINAMGRDSQLSAFQPVVEEALKHEGWSLFDLRPLRPIAQRLKMGPEFERVVLGFDFAVIVPKGDPSHEIM